MTLSSDNPCSLSRQGRGSAADSGTEKEGKELQIAPETQKLNW